MIAPSNFRIASTTHPILFEVNARVLLTSLSRRYGSAITLATIPEEILDDWVSLGFDAVWMMGIWQTGSVGRAIAQQYPSLIEEYRKALPDVDDADIVGSPYAVQAYEPSISVGARDGILSLQRRLHERGIALITDFVCNHTARDHAWVTDHPDYYVQGDAGDERLYPDRFFRAETTEGPKAIAFGRDPYFPGWTDTAQLNYRNPDLRQAMQEELRQISRLCDGVRCDMAMLVLNDVFVHTWPMPDLPPLDSEFWSQAIQCVREGSPGFLFIAEAYWNREWDLQQLGFDYTYDKTLYDRLLREGAGAVRDHLKAEMAYQLHCLRFIENHDEIPAASSMPSESWQYAAAVIAGTVPGLFFVHDGQLEGNPTRIPVQLVRRPEFDPNPRTQRFYRLLLGILPEQVFRNGHWLQLFPRAAWGENHSWTNFVASWWHSDEYGDRLVLVNYAPLSSQCYIDIPVDLLFGRAIEFRDLMGPAVYVRDRLGLEARGMFFDLQPYGFHIFSVTTANRP